MVSAFVSARDPVNLRWILFSTISPTPRSRRPVGPSAPPSAAHGAPAIPVHGALLLHICVCEAASSRRRRLTRRWNTKGLIQITGLPSYPTPPPLSFLLRLPSVSPHFFWFPSFFPAFIIFFRRAVIYYLFHLLLLLLLRCISTCKNKMPDFYWD